MATNTIVLIILVVIAALLILAALTWALRNRRIEKRRAEAGVIRDKAVEQSHEVGQREARADETAAKSRAAQAEAEAMSAHAAGLEHEAQQRRGDAVTARGEVNREYERADKVDPGVHTGDTPLGETETRATPPPQDITGKQPRHG